MGKIYCCYCRHFWMDDEECPHCFKKIKDDTVIPETKYYPPTKRYYKYLLDGNVDNKCKHFEEKKWWHIFT